MKFHSKTLELIGKPIDTGNPDEVIAAERALNISFPKSVREWYANVDGRKVLAKYGNGDPALAPTEFQFEVVDGKRLVIVLIENQGVCWWGFDIDGGEDPPVYVNLDPPPDDLFQYSRSFSEFTFVRVFDHEGFWDEDRCSMEIYQSLTDDNLRTLRGQFKEEAQSLGWPGTVVYRFRTNLGRITIWQSDGQSDWILSAASPDELAALRSSVEGVCMPFD